MKNNMDDFIQILGSFLKTKEEHKVSREKMEELGKSLAKLDRTQRVAGTPEVITAQFDDKGETILLYYHDMDLHIIQDEDVVELNDIEPGQVVVIAKALFKKEK